MKGGGDNFMDSLGIWLFGVWFLHFSVAVDDLVLMGCRVVAVTMVDLTSKISLVTFVIVEVS